jgi:GAF domain-containing protein
MVALQIAAMVFLGTLSASDSLGLPGSIAVLLSVVAAVLTGPLGGVTVAAVGSAGFILFVSGGSTPWSTVAGSLVWILAALVAGVTAEGLRGKVRRRERRLRELRRMEEALNTMGTLLTSSLDSDEILDRAVRLAAEELPCDATAVLLRQDEEWRPLVAWNMPPVLLRRTFTPQGAPYLEQAFREGRAVQVLGGQAGEEEGAGDREEPAAGVREEPGGGVQEELGLAASLVVPLTVRGVREGVIVFSFAVERHVFTELERVFAVRAASRLAQALDNARLYERLSDVAVTLQTSLAHGAPAIRGVDADAYRRVAYSPQLVGGDFADVFRSGDTVVAVIGDVEGKGVGASALAETVRSGLRVLATLHPSPAFCLGHLDRVLLDEGVSQFCTALVVRLDARSGRAVLASAGHPAPVCAGPRGARVLEPDYGPPLGTFPFDYEDVEVVVDPDEVVLLYTDGLIEARGTDGELFGEQRLLGVLAGSAPGSAGAATAAVRDAVERFAPDLRDDLQLLAVRPPAPGVVRAEEGRAAA